MMKKRESENFRKEFSLNELNVIKGNFFLVIKKDIDQQ